VQRVNRGIAGGIRRFTTALGDWLEIKGEDIESNKNTSVPGAQADQGIWYDPSLWEPHDVVIVVLACPQTRLPTMQATPGQNRMNRQVAARLRQPMTAWDLSQKVG